MLFSGHYNNSVKINLEVYSAKRESKERIYDFSKHTGTVMLLTMWLISSLYALYPGG